MRSSYCALLLAALPVAVHAADAAPATLLVEGHGTASAPPDSATITFTLRGEGKTSDEAVKALVASRKTIEGNLAAAAPIDDWQDSAMKVSIVRGADCKGERYSETEHLSQGPCAILGYVATMPVDLRTTEVAKAATLVGLISRLHGEDANADFMLADRVAARRKAIALAIANARAQAEAMAEGAHLRLGRILGIRDADVHNGDGPMQAPPLNAPASRLNVDVIPPPISVEIKPSLIDTTARVSVSYEILL